MDNRHTNTDSGSTWISMRRSSQSRSRDTSQSATAGPEAEGQSEPPSATALASGAPAAAPRTSPAFAGAYSRDRPSTPHRVIVYRTNYSGRRGNGESDDNTDGDNSDSNSEDGDDNGDNSSHAADMSVYANDYEESASGSDSSSDADPNSDDDGDGDEDEDEDYISDYGLIDESAADYDLYNQAMVVNVVNIGDEEEDTSDNSHGHGASSSDDEHQSSDPARSPGSRSGRSALMSISGSFENLPSLTDASAPSNKSSARRARGSSSSGRSKNSFYLPEYLEKSVYGAINRSLRERRARVKSTDKMPLGSLPDTPASNADCESAIAQLAPDMFFKTLVQDTWPHYCTPVSSMSTFNGLRLGYGLDLRGEAHNASSELRQRGVSSALSSTGLRRPMQARDGAASEDGGVRSSQQAFPSALAVTQRANGESLDRDARLHRLPSEWSPVRNSQNITAASNRLDIRYTGPGRVDHDAAMILANNSIPMHVGVYYYEVFIKSRGQSGYIGIGLTRSNMLLTRLPGWDAGSWGFHGDDGNCFGGDGRGRPYGPGFKSGDTVGCGVNFANRRIFFTRNGVFLGYAFDNIDTSKPLYPCVGMRTQGEHVVANFGRSGFVFDICHYVNSVHEEALANVRSTSLASVLPKNMLENSQGQDKEEEQEQNGAPRPASIVALRSEALKGVARGSDSEIDQSDATLCIVLEHLLHNECYATAQALIENAVGNRSTADGASGASDAPSTKIEAVLQMLQQQDRQRVTRKRICSHIRRGEIDAALGLLQDAYPAVLESEPIVFQLRCRQFVELVRLANGDSIASSIPNDDQQLPRPAGASSWRGQTGDMMDVDDSHSPAMLSLTAITNGPSLPRHVRFGQIGNVQSMDQAQLVRVLLEYGRQLQADYGTSSSAIVREGLVHTFSLLAYANPAQSPVSGLLDPAAREPLASLVEMAIVASENAPRMSALECICRQTGTILRELSGHRNGAASLMSLKHDFIGGSGSIE
ncbi:hypothetical protein LPJ75_002037 [Coemansia sp. RSA 2598]|nr:hypothetical protein LPJ75_002037 [Coemansia sp. RSA 2598]